MKKFWRFLNSPGVMRAVAFVGLVLAIYTSFVYERRPELVASVDTLSKVFDIHRPIGGLEVSYAGENLRAAKKTLWVLTATIKNVGKAEIRMSDYDTASPLGFAVEGAVIAERPTLRTNVAYIRENLKVSNGESLVAFSPVILEVDDSFEVTLLLLGSESVRPKIVPIGKIAGIKSIGLLTPESPSSTKAIWGQAVESTSVWVHLVRVVIYPVAALFLLVVTGMVVVGAFVAVFGPRDRAALERETRKRERKIQKYRQYDELGKESRYLMDSYVARGNFGLARVARYIRAYHRRRELAELLSGKLPPNDVAEIAVAARPFDPQEGLTEDDLREARMLEGEGASVTLSPGLEKALLDLCLHLEIDQRTLLSWPYAPTVRRTDAAGNEVDVPVPGDVD